MSNDLPMSYNDMKGIAKDFVKSGLFAQFRNPEQALVTIMAGREFGLGPFEAITSMYVVQGKPSFYSHKFADMIKRSGKYDYKVVEQTEKLCSIDFLEQQVRRSSVGGEETSWKKIGNSTFTLEDAEKADLLKNPNFKKYPRNMLYARAMTNGAKWYCPDAFHGTGAYEPSELGAVVEWAEDGTQTVVSAPEPEGVYEETPKKAYKANGLPNFAEAATQPTGDSIPTNKEGGKLITDAIELTVASCIEKQTKSGEMMGEITFLEALSVQGVEVRWPEYSVSYWVYQEKADDYRALEEGDKVLVKLSFESKQSGDKVFNYQNCELIAKLEEDVDKDVAEEVPQEETQSDTEVQQQEML